MFSLFTLTAFAATITLWRLYVFIAHQQARKGLKELPGPKGYPIIGILLEFPKEYSYRKMKDWGDEYGPIYKFNIMGTTHIVISSQKIADDLLSHKGAIYSDRPIMTMAYELVSRGGNMPASPMNAFWRNARKFAQTVLSSSAMIKWQPAQAAEVPRLVCDLVQESENYAFFFERFSTTLSLRQIYGKSLPHGPVEKYHVDTMMGIMRETEIIAAPGACLVDFIPALKYLPAWLAQFKVKANEIFKHEFTFYSNLVGHSRATYTKREPKDLKCFAHTFFDKESQWNLSDFQMTYTLGFIFGGGSGTTSATMQSFCLAMCHYPRWQSHLQKEVDEVVGPNRIPTFEDMPNLPTVRAIIKETLRWRPVVAGGVPHRVTQDDEYNGYYIPGGSVIHANQFAMVREEALYPDPETFNPDRWLNPKYPTYREPLTQYPNLKRYLAFGFGRRICPGLDSAERALFIQVSNIAWACNIQLKKDENGSAMPVPWYDYVPGANTHPKKFYFDIRPRSGEKLRMMQENVNIAK